MTSVALAGAGHVAVVHALAARELGFTVTAVASRTPERARELAAEVGARSCRYEDLPAGADLVVVATPPPWHVGPAMAALQAGATVLVEKPLAATLADADRLVAAEHAAGGRVVYGENLCAAPVLATALSRARGLGPLVHLESRLLMPPPDWGEFLTGSWGGGALFDTGAHPVGLVLAAAGEHDRPVTVSARLEARPGALADEHGEATITFGSGLRARVEASWRHHTRVRDLQASSATGVVRAELLPDRSLELDGEPVPLPEPPEDPLAHRLHEFGFVEQLRRAAELTRSGRPAPFGARFGRAVLDVLCAAYASAGRGGEPVDLPFGGDRARTPLELWRAT